MRYLPSHLIIFQGLSQGVLSIENATLDNIWEIWRAREGLSRREENVGFTLWSKEYLLWLMILGWILNIGRRILARWNSRYWLHVFWRVYLIYLFILIWFLIETLYLLSCKLSKTVGNERTMMSLALHPSSLVTSLFLVCEQLSYLLVIGLLLSYHSRLLLTRTMTRGH